MSQGSVNPQVEAWKVVHSKGKLLDFCEQIIRERPVPEKLFLLLTGQTMTMPRKEYVLSRRQREILFLVSVGWSNVNIAAALNITEYTVKTHMKNICHRLGIFKGGASERTLAVAEGIRRFEII